MRLRKIGKRAVVCALAGFMIAQQGAFGQEAWGAGPGGPGAAVSGGPGVPGTGHEESPEGSVEVGLPFSILVVRQDRGGIPVYAAPGFDGGNVNTLWPKEPVRLLEHADGDWAKVLYSGQERYVYTGDGAFEERDVWYIPESDAGRANLVAYAMQYLGAPYQYGGNDPATGSDCSGFVRHVMASQGVSLPRTSAGQAGSGAAVADGQARVGDILAFGSGGINHVGIYVGDGMMLHSENSENGVTVTSLEFHTDLAGVRRVLPEL